MRERRKRGNAILEFALASVVVFPVLGGVYQFGYTYYVYNNLESNARAAARYAAQRTYDSPNATPSTNYTNAVKNMLVYGQPTAGGTPVAPGLSPEQVSVTVIFEKNIPARVTVNVTNYQINGIFGRITLQGKPRAAFPYVGRWAPV